MIMSFTFLQLIHIFSASMHNSNIIISSATREKNKVTTQEMEIELLLSFNCTLGLEKG